MLIVMDAAASPEDIRRVVDAVESLGLQAHPIPGAQRTARTLYTHAPWGDLLVVSADGEPARVPSAAALAAMVASAHRATTSAWDAFVQSTR